MINSYDANSDFNKLKNRLANALDSIDVSKLEDLVRLVESTFEEGGRVYLAGNGGSSATCDHLANDLILHGIRSNRKADCVSLTSNTSLITCIANDYGYEFIFSKVLESQVKKGDLLINFSASGNSKNLIHATNVTKQCGGKVASILGFSGGELNDLSDLAIHCQTDHGDYGCAEDSHLVVSHFLSNALMTRARANS